MSQALQKPLIAIIGATGTGKSELAVEIASRFNGEIINGDAMQLYHGLPIITNKMLETERKGIPHHLLGCIGLEEETWTVGKFVEKALIVIEEIRQKGKLPILVGGTHYYTQSLLFQDTLVNKLSAFVEEGELSNVEQTKHFPILDRPTEVILTKLREVDPVMADRWHPNDRRKIQHSLGIWLKTGNRASQVYEEQRMKQRAALNQYGGMSSEDDVLGPKMRFPSLIFWVHASREALHARLDSRIIKMLQNGLLSEVSSLSAFRVSHEVSTGIPVDQTRGIWVSIGYKEFISYQTALVKGIAPEAELEKLKLAAIEHTQAATRQYANRQVRWIRIKLLNALASAGETPNLFLLDGTDLTRWDDRVLMPAVQVTQQFLGGYTLPAPTGLSEAAKEMLMPKRQYDLSQRRDLWVRRTCELCEMVAVTEGDWDKHIKSRRHRRVAATKKKRQEKIEIKGDDVKIQGEERITTLEKWMDIFDDK
ncbi:tRNA isopentenyltransferase [Glonium stellatum]|uniref:tRNA dimethylallyltransferase n=1 Tax=Glonium stellatum TaxID=574774 RepID=A0A8E2EV44_9PEZI|nr:tRNA isopentenyltransferase [Glonium stellatum]